MKATLFMAISINGFVARLNGDEDFLSNENWKCLLSYAKKYEHLIWGRKTYEAVKSWGGDYLESLKDISIIVVSKNNKSFSEKNVTVCQSPQEAIKIIKGRKYKKAFLSGGPSLNSSFAEAGLIDEVILNCNPAIISDGINLFSKGDFELNLKFEKVDEFSSGIIQLHYYVL
ncbi:MAG: Dihydrofolate reductase region [Candidatus Moranbacteria bacterium GW2011_GWE1_35_17]|nr:MAG: Dihydrofolate reductase region [Candidatus Moranbacteria bacterium GW2011_GWE1_35_17]KKP81381.1 MAG: Dihydrofolate reductase region [Candidatus Moranbacteria bacterium GW2011_GWF1_35_5]